MKNICISGCFSYTEKEPQNHTGSGNLLCSSYFFSDITKHALNIKAEQDDIPIFYDIVLPFQPYQPFFLSGCKGTAVQQVLVIHHFGITACWINW